MLHSHLKYFGVTVFISQILRSVLFDWDPRERKLSAKPNLQKRNRCLVRKLWIHMFAIIVMGFQGIYDFSMNSEHAFTDKFIYGFGYLYIFSSHFQLQVCRVNVEALCLYVNGILDFGRNYPLQRRQLLFIEKLNVYFAKAFCSSVMTLPVSYIYGLHWNDPCKPSIIGSFLLRQCRNLGQYETGLDQIAKVLVFLGNHWIWAFTLNVSLFVVSGIQVLCTLSLRGYLKT